MSNLYKDLGGEDTIFNVLQCFYQKIREDDLIRRSFSKVDINRLIEVQTQFLCEFLGGTGDYDPAELMELHNQVNFSAEDFSGALKWLEIALREAAISIDDVQTILETAHKNKHRIINIKF